MSASRSEPYDLIVIGGGAAGLGAAKAAAWERARVALISDAPLGGDCTFTGCIPSKALIEASRQGLTFAEALERVRSVVAKISATENAEVIGDMGVDVIDGRAQLMGKQTVAVGEQRLETKNIIVATGSYPTVPAIAGLTEISFRTNETFFDERAQPERLAIIGGGPMGCELAEAMARFGTKVTLIESAARLLGRYEPDAAELVAEGLQKRGVDVRCSTSVVGASQKGTTIELDLGDHVVEADELLLAAGRTAATSSLGLQAAGVAVDARGFITTSPYLQTTVRGIYAAGDCTGKQMLSHAADEMGRLAAWTALRPGRRYRYRPERIPHAVFTTPEVASIGVLEQHASADASVAEIEMHASDRAVAAADDVGFVRLISAPGVITKHHLGGKVIGATIVGRNAGEMINEVALVMRTRSYGARLAQTARAYPSWSTVMQKAATRWFYEYEGGRARRPRRDL